MALYDRITIRWTDENLTRLYACSLHPRDYELPPDHLAPRPAAVRRYTGTGCSLMRDPSPPGGLFVAPSLDDEPDNSPPGTEDNRAGGTASPPPWARLPWQQEIFRAYLRVSRGLPPTGPLYADEEEIINARITAWIAANAADSTHAKTIDELCAWLADPAETPPLPTVPEPRREQVANLVIVPSLDTGDSVAHVGPDLAHVLTKKKEAYETSLAEFLYDFTRFRHFNHAEAIEYHMEWEHAMLQMRRRAADLEWRGYGGDAAARDHACICHLLLNTFQVIDIDICGLQFAGIIMQWEVSPTTSTFPVSVWFLARTTGALFRLTMSEPFRIGELPIARALDGTMAFQHVEQGPSIFDLFGFLPREEGNYGRHPEQYLSHRHQRRD